MTSNEIKKAWKCCTAKGNCADCPLSGKEGCTDTLSDETLVYINELDTENNAMHKLLEKKRNATYEAIKEFTERFKNEITDRYEDIAYKDLFFSVIDKLVKEMVGENNATK